MATIGGTYKGMIVFPDTYVHPDGTDFVASDEIYNMKSNYAATVSVEGWRKMEVAGAIFLPAAGYRDSDVVMKGANVDGRYWSSSYRDKQYAFFMKFSSDGNQTNYEKRCNGYSVRLVRDVR